MNRSLPVLGLLLAFLGVGPGSAEAQVPDGTNRFDCPALYDAGDYSGAAACFENLDRNGSQNGHLLYNLGNAHYRAGNTGEAVLAYRRASLYLPRDGDLKANLASARDQVQDDLLPPNERSPLLDTLLAPYDALSHKELLLLGLLAWILLFTLLSVRNYRPLQYWKLPAACLAFLALGGLLGSLARSYQSEHHPNAVVLADEVTLRSGQDLQSTALVRLHAGAEVGTVELTGNWGQVALSTGTRGWLPLESLGLVRQLPPRGD